MKQRKCGAEQGGKLRKVKGKKGELGKEEEG